MERRKYKLLKLIPWVKELEGWSERPRQCTAFKRPRPCKNKARWEYRFGKSNASKPSGVDLFCTAHLIHQGLFGDMSEEFRYNTWWDRWGRKKAGM